MNRTLSIITSVLVSGTLSAQTISWLPSDDTHDYQGLAISANGRFLSGLSKATTSGFVWDTTSATEYLTGEDNGTIMLGVADNGTAVGYDADDAPTIFDMTTQSTYAIESNIKAIPYSISSDGKLIVGYTAEDDGNVHACIWKEGKRTMLPEPTSGEAFLSAIAGTDAKWTNADGSVILGTVYEKQAWGTWPLASVWKLQEDGSYKFVPIYKDFYDVAGDASKPFYAFTPAGISDNGKWISLKTKSYGTYLGEMALYPDRMARMNLDNMKVSECQPGNGLTDLGYITGGISNDGTVVGAVNPNQQRSAVIWESGSQSAMSLAMRYGMFEINDLYTSAAIGISADGRYITGFGKKDDDSGASMTYWIDTKGSASSISSAASGNKGKNESYIYDMSGCVVGNGDCMTNLKKGIYIIKTTNGGNTTTRKITKR